ncbi:uncharacterized protein J4E88_006025 [Alternaria novae-zelandiae]|uniref:uncharacterized protein n=1 Tax=Alternaria novae-zelandiae TaxID=430562 RepID=UPI0020C383BC|nr:uncharacterized protein J4E88_006025 [Alternaria novae-zelandiae]KAI4680134.1 hypothetical protein J4E88_006025 [Alternaria novae-zelandiae]
MAAPPLTEKQVYLALKDIFSIGPTPPSTAKKIRKNIEKYRYDAKVAPLVQRYGVEGITAVAFALSGNQIFASTEKAKTRFPDVFGGLSNEPSSSTASVSQTVTDSASAIQPAVTESSTAADSVAAVPRVTGAYSPEELMGIGDRLKARKEGEKINNATSHTQSFDSVALPLWDQHRTLVKVQYTLEKACFGFAQERLVGLLQREGWDCAEAVELNQWARTLLICREEFKLDDMDDDVKPLPSLMESIIQLRHNAVHRVRLSSSGLLQHLNDAVLLAQLLRNEKCGKFLTDIRRMTHDAIEELVRNKQLLDGRLADIKTEFAAKRAELERQEAALLEATVNEHKMPMVSVSGSLHRLSDDHGGTTEQAHAPWLRVYNADLPADGSSGPEDTTSQSPENEAIIVIDDDADVVSPPPMHPVPIPPVDDVLLEPVIQQTQQEVEKDEDNDLSIVETIPIEESKLDDHESNQGHSLDPPPLDQDDTATDTEEASEGHVRSLEKADVSDWEDSKFQENDEEIFYEPSTSLVSTCVDEAVSDALELHQASPIEDQIRVIAWDPDGSERKRQRVGYHLREQFDALITKQS